MQENSASNSPSSSRSATGLNAALLATSCHIFMSSISRWLFDFGVAVSNIGHGGDGGETFISISYGGWIVALGLAILGCVIAFSSCSKMVSCMLFVGMSSEFILDIHHFWQSR